LVVSTNPSIGNLIVSTLGNIGIKDVLIDGSLQSALLHVKAGEFDLVVCAVLSDKDTFAILSAIRKHISTVVCRVPVICVAENWESEQISAMRDAGVTALSTLPLTLRNLLKQVTRVMNDKRDFIVSPTYRGPCRRGAENTRYSGPFRRSTDNKEGPRAVEADTSSLSTPEARKAAAPDRRTPERPQVASFVQVEIDDTSHDPIENQTGKAVASTIATANHICSLFNILSVKADQAPKSKDLLFLSVHLERWVNLMGLVSTRIDVYGCSPKQLDALTLMSQNFQGHLVGYVNAMASSVAGDGRKLLDIHSEIPVSLVNPIRQRMDSINALLGSLGKVALDDGVTANLESARTIVGSLIERSGTSIALKEFDKKA